MGNYSVCGKLLKTWYALGGKTVISCRDIAENEKCRRQEDMINLGERRKIEFETQEIVSEPCDVFERHLTELVSRSNAEIITSSGRLEDKGGMN